jgi:hypothetical protein
LVDGHVEHSSIDGWNIRGTAWSVRGSPSSSVDGNSESSDGEQCSSHSQIRMNDLIERSGERCVCQGLLVPGEGGHTQIDLFDRIGFFGTISVFASLGRISAVLERFPKNFGFFDFWVDFNDFD